MKPEELQAYVNQLQAAKLASQGVFDATTVSTYANAIEGLEAKQAALLLSTQGLTTAQIAETLAVNESNVAKNYQAMADAGLLARKQKLTVAQVKENLQTVLGAEADTSAAMASLGLSASIEGQEHQTVQLTAKKLQEAVATNVLTEAQAQEFAMRIGMTLAMQKQAASTLPKWIATLQAATKAVWGQVKATAVWLATTPAGWATAAIAAIGGVIAGLNKYAKKAKEASDKAQEAYEKSKERTQSNKEEAKSLDELIKKYDELKSASEMDSGTRTEIKELQYDIVELVGAQAKNLDLVNGKLDEELAKLKGISAEKARQNVEDTKDSYDKAAYMSDVMVGDADGYGNDVVVKWMGTEADQIHKADGFSKATYDSFVDFMKENGFGDIFRKNYDENLFNMKFVVDTKDIDGLENKIARLLEFKDFLAGNGLKGTGVYQGVVSAIERYQSQYDNELEAANAHADALINDLYYSNEKLSGITVGSVDTFEQYRQAMLSEVKSDGTIGEAMADGILSEEDIEKSVNNFMATANEFSNWYMEWQDKLSGSNTGDGLADTLSTQLTNSQESLDKFQSSVKSAADAYTTLLSGNYSSTELLDSIQAINQAVTDMGESIVWEEIDSLDLLGDKLEEVSRDYAESILSGAGIDVGSDFGQMLADIIQQTYEVEAKFTGMNAQLDRLQSSYKTLTDVLESYNETGYISLDNLQSLLTADENLIAMLEVENGKLVINQEAYENLVAVQLQEFKEKLDNAAAAEIEALALNKAEEATDKNAKASEDAVAKLDAETEAFGRNTSAAIANAMAKAEKEGVSEEEIQGILDKYTEVWNAAVKGFDTDFPTFMNGAKSAGEDVGKAFTEALEKELNALDTKMEAGYIDFNDYIQARLNLIEGYYKQGKIKADEYYSYLEKHYDKQLIYMDKAVSAVTRRIDKEIDALEKQKDDVESIYQVQIDALEKQKTLLEEANKERQQQVDLQKAISDMERAENQRTSLVYTEDKGMIYKSDPKAIRDAKGNVDNARYEIQISKIEKAISNLEEAREKETDAIDDMVSKLNEYKDAWNDVTSAYEEEQENLIAAQILGADWETDILNGRLDILDAFKNQYIDIQQAIVDAAWKSADEQVKAAKEAEKGSSGSASKAPKIGSTKDATQPVKISGGGSPALGGFSGKRFDRIIQTYASGTAGLPKAEKNALVSEYGQTEMTALPNGDTIITDEPTLMDLPKNTVIFNEEQTKKIMGNKVDASGKAYAGGTNDGSWIGADGHRYRPIQPGDRAWELQKAFEPFVDKILKGEMDIISNAVFEGQKQMERWTKEITNNTAISNITNNRNMQPVINGGINITCPGVTSQEVARQVGAELNNMFQGFHNFADQQSRKR